MNKKLDTEKNWLDTHTDLVSLIEDSMARCFAFSAKYLLQDDSIEEDDDEQEVVEEKSNN